MPRRRDERENKINYAVTPKWETSRRSMTNRNLGFDFHKTERKAPKEALCDVDQRVGRAKKAIGKTVARQNKHADIVEH